MNNSEGSSTGSMSAIGIDLGTTNSCVAYWDYDHAEIIHNDFGNRITPSIVSFTNRDKLVGDAAQQNDDPHNTIYAVKRLIGCRFSDPVVKNDISSFPFTVVCSENDTPNIVVQCSGEKRLFSAEQISSMILMELKQMAETFFGGMVKDAVITVPAYFSDSQRRATKNAGKMAGLNVKRIMDEPTAAALGYSFHKIENYSMPKSLFMFDLGGGTFDASLIEINCGNFNVKAIAGDSHLGGEDFTNRMLNYCIEEFRRTHAFDIETDQNAKKMLKAACEKAKKTLSTRSEALVRVNNIYPGQDFCLEISRDKFNELNKDLFEKCIELTDQCFRDSRFCKEKVDLVVLAGGSSRIHKVQDLLEHYFINKKLHRNIPGEEAVAYGAALMAAKLTGKWGNILGAIDFTEVTPLSLGVEVVGGVMEIIIPRNTPIPAMKVKNFSTLTENATSVDIIVYEGERVQASSNNLLGKFVVSGISPAPRGEPLIKVCFEVDADGILDVSGTECSGGHVSKLKLTYEESWLRKETVKTMINDAEKSKREDGELKRNSDAWNDLNSYAIITRKTMRQELFFFTSECERKKIEDKISDTFSWLDINKKPFASVEATKSKLNELKKICEPIKAIGLRPS